MKTTFLFAIFCSCIFLTTSCSDPYEYWNVSHFKIDETALKDQEKVKLIYSSRGPEKDVLDYYHHLIVVTEGNGDTINILSPVDNKFSQSDANKIFTFTSQKNAAYKVIQRIDKLKEVDIDKTNFIEYSKVARDPKFDFIADNDFPTSIGFIGDLFHR